MFIWTLVSGIRDLRVSTQAFQCTQKSLGPEFQDYLTKNKEWQIGNTWNYAAKDFIDLHTDPEVKKKLSSILKTNCAKYLTYGYVTTTKGCFETGPGVDHWSLLTYNPAYFSQFIQWLLMSLSFALFFVFGPQRLWKFFRALLNKLKLHQ